MTTKQPPILLLILFSMALVLSGCATSTVKPGKTSSPETKPAASSGSVKVMMLGRSVMGGWFSHWAGDTSQPYDRDDFSLYYREIEGPDAIMDSVQSRVDEDAGQADIIFFKLCFVDFNGDDRDSAESNLKRNEDYVRRAYDIAVTRAGKKLVIGNALPQVAEATSGDLVWNHRQYNAWLNGFAADRPGQVWIFDEYGILADAEGSLKAEYAASSDDSHPNDSGYAAMDEPFFNLLKSVE